MQQRVRAQWMALPRPARWFLAYVVLLVIVPMVGLVTVGWGEALFLAGALMILIAAGHIRLGGERVRVTLRDAQGAPILREPVAPEERKREIHRGVLIFLLGIGLWVPMAIDFLL